jgi:uncharacterized protein YdhG (YjbR/CyaY superfamily)
MDVNQYISQFPDQVQEILHNLRNIILDCAPNAVEGISYGMPGYKLNHKPLVYFAAYKNHIGFYATPTGHNAFKKELSAFKQGKGSVQFPLTEAMPYDLIAKIVRYRVSENEQK